MQMMVQTCIGRKKWAKFPILDAPWHTRDISAETIQFLGFRGIMICKKSTHSSNGSWPVFVLIALPSQRTLNVKPFQVVVRGTRSLPYASVWSIVEHLLPLILRRVLGLVAPMAKVKRFTERGGIITRWTSLFSFFPWSSSLWTVILCYGHVAAGESPLSMDVYREA